jgi:hypothetical protein
MRRLIWLNVALLVGMAFMVVLYTAFVRIP